MKQENTVKVKQKNSKIVKLDAAWITDSSQFG